MGIAELLMMAAALAMDALAVSMTRGMCCQRGRLKNMTATALAFGAAQMAMPIAGYCGGTLVASRLLETNGNRVAAVILGLIGIKMIVGAVQPGASREPPSIRGKGVLFLQAVATSIDALAVGVGLCGVSGRILLPAAIIGSVTALLCAVGFALGAVAGSKAGTRAQIAGGAILLGLAIKMLVWG